MENKLTVRNIKTNNIMDVSEEYTSMKNGKQYFYGFVYGQTRPVHWKKANCVKA